MIIEHLKNIRKLYVYSESLDDDALSLIQKHFIVNFKPTEIVLGDQKVFTFSYVEPRKPLDPPSFSSYSSPNLNGKIASSECTVCEQPLITLELIGTLLFKDLPSNYWMELIDCWSCHKSEFAVITNKVNFSEEKPAVQQQILPASGVAHVGLDGIIFHKDDLAHFCNGQALGDHHVKVNKHSIRFKGEADIGPVDSVSLLVGILHESMEAHGSHSFIISCFDQSVGLKVLNWSVSLLDSVVDELRHAVKVHIVEDPADPEHVTVDKPTFQSLNERLESSMLAINDAKIALLVI